MLQEMGFYQWYVVGLSVLNFLLFTSTGVVAFITNKHEKAMAKISDNQLEMIDIKNNHSVRITGIEEHIKSMPEFKNMAKLQEQLHVVDNKCAMMTGQLFGIEKKLSMIDKHLMDKK